MLFLKILGNSPIFPPRKSLLSWRTILSVFLFLLSHLSHYYAQCNSVGQHVSCSTDPVVLVLPTRNNKDSCAPKIKSSPIWRPRRDDVLHLLGEDSDGKPLRIAHCGEVSFSCWAPQPVTWDYDGPWSKLKIKSINATRSPRDGSSFCYNAILTLTVSRKFHGTGKYACYGLTEQYNSDNLSGIRRDESSQMKTFNETNFQSSFYLYRNEEQPVAFQTYKRGQKILHPNEFIVPCRANSQNISAILEKKDNSLSKFQQVNQEEFNVTYDPKVGFRLRTTPEARKSLLGKYRCTDKYSSAYTDVEIKQDGTEKRPSLSTDLDIQFHDDVSCRSISCSSKSTKISPTYLRFFDCTSAIHCSVMLQALLNDLSETSTKHSNMNDDSCGIQSSREVGSVISFSSEHLRMSSAGMAVCSSEDGREYQSLQYLTSQQEIVYSPGPFTPPNALMTITTSKKTLYVNETIVLDCSASKFLFSDGLKWLVMYSNGSVGNPVGMELASKNDTSKERFNYHWSMNVTTDDIVSYICLAPYWNSSQWMNISYPVKAIDGKPPLILTNASSQVQEIFSYDQKKVGIRCEAWGIPQPEITWWRGDLEFLDETQNAHPHIDLFTKEDLNISISTLMFETAVNNGSSITGEYTCNATNPKGTVLRTIRVRVESPSTWKVWAVSIGVCISVFVSILIFYLHKFWKKSEDQEKYINELTTQDKELFQYGQKDVLSRHATLADLEKTLNSGRDVALVLPYQKQYEINEADIFIDEFSRKLGEGNYGVVIHGNYRTKTGETMDVAVKTLKQWNPSQAKAMLDEVKILTYVGKHEHVVSLVGAITNMDECKIQVILEYCAEGSLDKYLVDKKNYFLDEISNDQICFSLNTAVTQSFASSYVRIDYAIKTFDLVRWSYQIACGMQYLASRKIIHGDLAVRNLLLTDTRDLKISDFGLSKKLADTKDEYIPSRGIQQDQPWRSLAPEWFKNKILSSATDVWAYGITLWEIFSLAETPYPEYPSYGQEFCNALQKGHRNPKPQYANSYIYNILLSCWDADPSKRPTFSDLTKKFFDLLPRNYVKTIDVSVYQPSAYVTPRLDYVLHEQVEQFQLQQPC